MPHLDYKDRTTTKKELQKFATYWSNTVQERKNEGTHNSLEKQRAQQYWSHLLHCFGIIPEMIDLYEKNAARATTGNTGWIDLFISGTVIGEAKSPGKREAYRVKVKTTADTDRFRRVSCSARGPYASVNWPLVKPHRDALDCAKARAFTPQSRNRDFLGKRLHSEQCNYPAPWVGAKYAHEYPYMSEK